jgi:hypothetical protein
MTPLLLVVVSFGLVFVVTAALAQGFSLTKLAFEGTLSAHKQLNVMLLLINFILMPALLIGITSLTSFKPQAKMAIIVVFVSVLEAGKRFAGRHAGAAAPHATRGPSVGRAPDGATGTLGRTA